DGAHAEDAERAVPAGWAAHRSQARARARLRRGIRPRYQALAGGQLHRRRVGEAGMKSIIRVRMSAHDAHYGRELVGGAGLLALFGDVATGLRVRPCGDEGLFRAFESGEFLAPVKAGDYIEAEGEIVRWGKTSLGMKFVARKLIQSEGGPTARA